MGQRAVSAPVDVTARCRSLGWSALGGALCILVLATLPARQVRLGAAQLRGLVGTYLYSQGQALPPPLDLRVTQIYLPKTMRVEWDLGETLPEEGGRYYVVQRVNPSTQAVLESITTFHQYWVDAFDFTLDTPYEYRVQVQPLSAGSELPPPPWNAQPEDIEYYDEASEWSTLVVVPRQCVAADNQTVDSRLDLRYGNPTPQNFPFGSRIYRGGLFTGYAGDASKVGRTFLRFELPELPSGATFLAGSVNAHHTASWSTGTTEIGCQEVNDVTWDEDTLQWTLAPPLTPGDATERFDVAYDSDDPEATTTWAHWNQNAELDTALNGSGLISFGLASTSESTSRWVYFAKRQYDSSKAPVVLYAYEPAP